MAGPGARNRTKEYKEWREIGPVVSDSRLNMMIKAVATATLLFLFGCALAEPAANSSHLQPAKKGSACGAGYGSHHHHHRRRCCGCPKKGAVFKVTKLNEIFLDLFLSINPETTNLVDTTLFAASVQGGLLPIPNFCCSSLLNFQSFTTWFYGLGSLSVYPIFEEDQDAYERHDGCVVVPYDIITVTPVPSKAASQLIYSSTLAYQVKATWCPADGCNWKLTGMEWISYACLNTTAIPCTPP
jgi:hypothetical protein